MESMDMGPLQFLDEGLEFFFGCRCKPTTHNYGNVTVCDPPLAGLLLLFGLFRVSDHVSGRGKA
jgi:hypothetical protein